MFKQVSLKLGKMRKPQNFVVTAYTDSNSILIQSNKSIGKFNKETGEGKLSTIGTTFLHLADFFGAKPYTLTSDELKTCLDVLVKPGDTNGIVTFMGVETISYSIALPDLIGDSVGLETLPKPELGESSQISDSGLYDERFSIEENDGTYLD